MQRNGKNITIIAAILISFLISCYGIYLLFLKPGLPFEVKSGGSGTAMFELSNKIRNYNWYIEFNGTNYTNSTTPFYASSVQSPLPVTMNSMNLTASGNSVTLKWQTTTEVNNRGFSIERRNTADTVWQYAGYLEGAGTSGTGREYSFSEKIAGVGKYSYRLRQTDYNGNFAYLPFSEEAEILAPGKFALYQNYPNPFNPITTISFDIPEKTKVTLTVFDMTGRTIETLINKSMSEGRYEIEWNAGKYSSGVYFYVLSAGGSREIKKMVLLK